MNILIKASIFPLCSLVLYCLGYDLVASISLSVNVYLVLELFSNKAQTPQFQKTQAPETSSVEVQTSTTELQTEVLEFTCAPFKKPTISSYVQSSVTFETQSTATEKVQMKEGEVQAQPESTHKAQEMTIEIQEKATSPLKAPRPRANSEEFKTQHLLQEKELTLSEVCCEATTKSNGGIVFKYIAQMEAESPIQLEGLKEPIFVSLVGSDHEVFKDVFKEDERFVKLKTVRFSETGDSYLEDPQFQFLFSSVLFESLGANIILAVDSPSISQELENFLKYKYLVGNSLKTLYVLHSSSDLNLCATKFTQNLTDILNTEEDLSEVTEGIFEDKVHNIVHLKASLVSSYEFIESRILRAQRVPFNTSLSATSNFNFTEHFKKGFVSALKYLLIPVFTEELDQFKAVCEADSYGFCMYAKYKNLQEMPKTLFHTKKPPKMLHVNPVSLAEGKLFCTLHTNTPFSSISPTVLAPLFVSPHEFSHYFTQSPTEGYIDVFVCNSNFESDLKNSFFEKLSSWMVASHICDFIVMFVDFGSNPELHHNTLLWQYLNFLKEVDKPLFILHKTGKAMTYQESFVRVNEMLEDTWVSDRVLLHEEITDEVSKNDELILQIREQMSDNLIDTRTLADFSKRFSNAFEKVVGSSLCVQNSRKRELLLKSDLIEDQEGLCCSASIEPTWSVTFREKFTNNIPENLLYVSPPVYHLDEDITLSVNSSTPVENNLVKVGVLFNCLPQNFNYSYLNLVSHSFGKKSQEVALVLPSAVQVYQNSFNHINSPTFNSISQNIYIDQLADCLIINLFYKEETTDLDMMSYVFYHHFREEKPKPIMVLHHLDSQLDQNAAFEVFGKLIEDFSEQLCLRGPMAKEPNFSTHKNQHEGIYAFDKENQVIHRLMLKDTPVSWKWYNAILYNIMHSHVSKFPNQPLKPKATQAFSTTLKSLLKIYEDEEPVIPIVHSNFTSHSLKLYSPIQPLWILCPTTQPEVMSENKDPNK